MKPIISPIEFIAPLSEVEVRMTLKELCGSKWDNYPFDGEVDKNSFRLIKNRSPFVQARGISKAILIGNFVGQDKQTKVKISLHTKITDIIGLLILVLGTIGLAGYGFISMLDKGFIVANVSAMMICCLGVGFFALDYFLIWSSFHNSANKIKKALGVSR
jgi:hypothetical protein